MKCPTCGQEAKLDWIKMVRHSNVVIVNGEEINLTRGQFKIFEAIYTKGPGGATYSQIMDKVWGDHLDPPFQETIMVQVHYIRKRFRGHALKIETTGQYGYRIIEDRESVCPQSRRC